MFHTDVLYMSELSDGETCETCFHTLKRFCVNLGAEKSLKHFVIQSVSEESREHKVDATEILPPFGRLNDTKGDFHRKQQWILPLN